MLSPKAELGEDDAGMADSALEAPLGQNGAGRVTMTLGTTSRGPERSANVPDNPKR